MTSVAVITTSLVAFAVGGFMFGGRYFTKHAHYREVRKYGNKFSLRLYEAHNIAETVVHDTDMRTAGSRGFRSLAGYIFGGTHDGSKISMTTPVQVEQLPAATTGSGGGEGGGGHIVRFFLPHGNGTPPIPLDTNVHIRAIPETLFAARDMPRTWDATLNGNRFAATAEELVRDVTAAGLHVIGLPIQLAYDPPWTPSIFRRNEVIVKVAEEGTNAG